jgi:hypothetical protein
MSFCLQSIENVLLSRIKGGMGCSHDRLLTRTNGYLVSNRQSQDKPNRAELGFSLLQLLRLGFKPSKQTCVGVRRDRACCVLRATSYTLTHIWHRL